MNHKAAQEWVLPVPRAFVLQLHAKADPAQGLWVGRVEHVQSGQATHFHTWEEFTAFIARVLASPQSSHPEVL